MCWCSRALGPHPEQQQPLQSSGARCLHGRGVSSPSGDASAQPGAAAAPARGCPRAGVAWLGCCPWLRQCSPMDSAPLAHSPGFHSPGAPSPHRGACGPPWPVTGSPPARLLPHGSGAAQTPRQPGAGALPRAPSSPLRAGLAEAEPGSSAGAAAGAAGQMVGALMNMEQCGADN